MSDDQQDPSINPIQQKIQDFDPVGDVQQKAAGVVNNATDKLNKGTDQAEQMLESGMQAVEQTLTETVDKIEGAFSALDNWLKKL